MSDLTLDVKQRLSAFLAEQRAKANPNTGQVGTEPSQPSVPANNAPAQVDRPADQTVPVSDQSVTGNNVSDNADSQTLPEPGAVGDDSKKEPTAVNQDAAQDNQDDEPVWELADESDTSTDARPSIDFKKLGSALGLEVNSESELVEAFKKQSDRVKELEKAVNQTFDGLDEAIKEVIDFARKGGNWKEYVTHMIIDLDQVDPIRIFEEEFEMSSAHLYKKPDGTIDWEKLDNDLNAIPDSIKIMQGKQIIQNMKANQMAKLNALKEQVNKRRDEFHKTLNEAVQGIGKVFGNEVYSLKVEPKHVSAIHNGIVTGKLTQKHLGVDADALIKAGVDARKLVETLAKAEWSESIAQYRYKQGKAQAKRELLERTQNVVVPAAGQAPLPKDVQTEQKQKAVHEKMAEYMSRFR